MPGAISRLLLAARWPMLVKWELGSRIRLPEIFESNYRPCRRRRHPMGLGVAWSNEDPMAARHDIIYIRRSLVRAG